MTLLRQKELNLSQPNIDYSQFGGEPVEEEIDYSQFGGDPVKDNEQEESSTYFGLGEVGVELNPFKKDKRSKERINNLKAVVSGETAGFSELIPGFEVEDMTGSTSHKIVGSLLPLGLATKAITLPLNAAAKLSPRFVKPLTSLGNLLGLSAAGGLYEGLEESAEKSLEAGEFVPPSPETILEQGGKWAALDVALRTLGWGGRFAKGLYDASVESGKPVTEVLKETIQQSNAYKQGEKIVEKALSILEKKPIEQIEKEIAQKITSQQKASQKFTEYGLDNFIQESIENGMIKDPYAFENFINNSPTLKKKADKIVEDLGKPLSEIIDDLTGRTSLKPKNQIKIDASQQAIEEQVEKRTADLRNKKIEVKDFSKIEQAPPKPYLPAEFEAETIAEEVMSKDLVEKIESTAQRATSDLELGKNIKGDIERTIETSKKETDALYEIAKKGEEKKFPKLQKTANAIVEQINKIRIGGLNLTPEGYAKADKQLVQTLTDLGYAVEMDASGNIVRAVENSRQPLSKVIEVKRRLNNIINYDLLDTSAQDFLKDPVFQLRDGIRKGYGPKTSPARKAFEEAESKFGEFAEKKGKKAIRNMRTTEKPESIAKTIKTPSGLEDVKQVVSPEQFAQIEREILEEIKGLNEQKAAEYYREIRPSLSSDSRAIAEEIIQSKAPKNSPTRKVAQREAIQKKAIDDIAKATITGQRPEVALDLWKTKEGQQLIKQALENNPNKKEVLKYLQDQSFKDFYSSIVNEEGVINFNKLDQMLADKATAANIRMVAGEDGYQFLKQSEQLSERIKKNVSMIEGKINKGSAKERAAIEREIEKKGKERLSRTKEKNVNEQKAIQESKEAEKQAIKDRYQDAIEESIGKKSASNRKAVQKQETRSGQRKFEEIKGKRAAEAMEKKAAEEALEKDNIIYKLDEFLTSKYGFKARGVLSLYGLFNYPTETLLYGGAFEGFLHLIKNKRVQQAFQKAALPKSSPIELIRALDSLFQELDQ